MAQVTFGDALREARERRGYDINTAAARLRIRPDIVRALEEDDLAKLPPRGYTKNMVNAYARLVGLNPADVTQMYLDADYAFRAGNARSSSARSSRSSRYTDDERSSRSSGRENSFGRVMYDDRKDYSHTRDYDRGPTEHIYAGERPRQSRHNALNSQYTNFYAGPKVQTLLAGRWPMVIAAVIILVLLIIVISLALGGGGGDDTPEAPKVPITGIDDTTGVDDGSSTDEAAKPKLTAPTSVTVTYDIAKDSDVYAVIVDNGVQTDQGFTGGEEGEYDVTGSWSFATWVPDAVTITVDGEPASFDSTDANGMPVCTVDFQTWLNAWYEAHPDVERTTTATAGTTTAQGATATGTDTAAASDAANAAATTAEADTGQDATGDGTWDDATVGTDAADEGAQTY